MASKDVNESSIRPTTKKTLFHRSLLAKVEPRWHGDFIGFVESGEASDGFLKHLDSSESCQDAVEMAFEYEIDELRTHLLEETRKSDLTRQLAEAAAVMMRSPKEEVARAMGLVVEEIATSEAERESLSLAVDGLVDGVSAAKKDSH